MEEYRYHCETVEGFVQRAVVLSQKGYRYFISGEVPERKAADEIDEKLLTKYGLRLTRRQRTYRKSKGLPNGHYFRFSRRWVVMGTSRKLFFQVDPNERVRDLRDAPIRVGGYSISLRADGAARRGAIRRLRASVRLEGRTLRELQAVLLDSHQRWAAADLERQIWLASNHWQVYAPVYRQFQGIVRRLNEARAAAGLGRVGRGCVRISRQAPRHFERACLKEAAEAGSAEPRTGSREAFARPTPSSSLPSHLEAFPLPDQAKSSAADRRPLGPQDPVDLAVAEARRSLREFMDTTNPSRDLDPA